MARVRDLIQRVSVLEDIVREMHAELTEVRKAAGVKKIPTPTDKR